MYSKYLQQDSKLSKGRVQALQFIVLPATHNFIPAQGKNLQIYLHTSTYTHMDIGVCLFI